jgi:hypothetical protein
MIVLNSSKELVKVDDWQSILSRPGFTENLNPNEHTLSAIIGSYAFKDKIRCGLSNCHTPHNKGYIATTTDGRETNMGSVCGKTHFGVDFEVFSRQFDEDIQEKRDRDYLWDFYFKLDQLKQRIDELRSQHRGGDWAYKKLRPFLDGGREFSEIARKVGQMMRSGSSDLTVVREATEDEIKSIELGAGTALKRPHYVEEKIGEVFGMDALYKENDLKDLLVLELVERIKEFEGQDIDLMSRPKLRQAAKWAGSVETTLDRAVRALASARLFLTTQNLQPILITIPDDARSAFTRYIGTLSDVPA